MIELATADRPTDRYESIDQFMSAVGGAIGLDVPKPPLTRLRNPYKGLSAFQESDSGDFFGRSEGVSELVGLFADCKLVAIIGPSGSGKSSLVHAGLIPAVRAGASMVHRTGSSPTCSPGPIHSRSSNPALGRVAVEDPGAFMEELDNNDRGLSRVIKRILPADTRLLLVIDQFEELFTLTHDEVARNRLLSRWSTLPTTSAPTRGSYSRCERILRPAVQYPEFGELLKEGIVPSPFPPMTS